MGFNLGFKGLILPVGLAYKHGGLSFVVTYVPQFCFKFANLYFVLFMEFML